MGVIRVILALSVVALHCGPFWGFNIVGGTIAVQLFYIISGFYMCMILSSKYKNKSKYLFYTNRAMKIYPVYIITLFFTIILSILFYTIFNNDIFVKNFIPLFSFERMDLFFAVAFSNLLILGQDLLFIFGYSLQTNSWFFEPNYIISTNPLQHYLFVGQAWTISLELMFYLLAPFLVKLNNRNLLIIIIFSIIMRFVTYHFGFKHKPWDYQFFPFELAFFVSGMLSYRLLEMNLKLFITRKFQLIVFIFILLSILFYPLSNSGEILKWSLYLVFVFSLPFIFLLFKKSELDRKVGELSYPIYITHLLIGTVVVNLFDFGNLKGILIAFGSIIFSIIINKFIQNPIELFRQQRIKHENSN